MSYVVELGLFRPGTNASEQASVLARMVERLLRCIDENAVDAGELQTAELRERLRQFLETLSGSPDPAELREASELCLRECEGYFARFQNYLAARDSEFSETIDVLRIAVSKVTGDSEGVNEALDESTRKFRRLNELHDIRHLRKELSRAVMDLESVVAEKKKLEHANHEKLARQIADLQAKVEESMAEALKDALTGVANRRGFDQTILRWIARASRGEEPFSLAMVDIDDFKHVNDRHGHSVGDRILTVAARCLRNGVRSSDYLARYGGEEFVVMLRGVRLDLAEQRMQETLAKIAASRYEYDGLGRHVIVSFTASCGLTEFVAGEPLDVLMRRADDALYEAKKNGKNCVVARRADAPAAAAAS